MSTNLRNITDPMTTPAITPAVFVAANRAVVYGTVARWLLHDLRNPTQALSLVTELLTEPGAETDPDLQATLSQSTRQLTVCVERLDRTIQTVPANPVPGPVVVSEVLKFLAQLYESCRSPVQLDLSQVIGRSIPAVSGVEEHVEHALLNLLMNGLEALTDRDDGRITVTASARESAVELVIDDNGPGVPSKLRDSLFEPYVTTKRRPARVTGLGLMVARYLLELSGGTLAYTQKDGPGTRFTIRLLTWPPA